VAGHIPADHELTTLVDAMFGPEAGPEAWLVHAVCSFGDYTFEAVRLDELEDFGAAVRDLRQADTLTGLNDRG
jgi:hypothetical protein